jgi:hypothetical protein
MNLETLFQPRLCPVLPGKTHEMHETGNAAKCLIHFYPVRLGTSVYFVYFVVN